VISLTTARDKSLLPHSSVKASSISRVDNLWSDGRKPRLSCVGQSRQAPDIADSPRSPTVDADLSSVPLDHALHIGIG